MLPFHYHAALAALVLASPATDRATAQEAPLRFVAGLPVVKAELRSGDRTYTCHLLVDTQQAFPLLLHRNAAGALRAARVDVEAGDLVLEQLPVQADRVVWLEQFTAQNAEGLQEVPLAGILGLPAFGRGTLILDGPDQSLRLASEAAGHERPPETPERAVVDLLASPLEGGIRVPVELEDGSIATFLVATRYPSTHVDPSLARRLGHPTGDLARARFGDLDLAAHTPFRPESPPGDFDGSLGGRLLSNAVTTVQLGLGWMALELPATPEYPRTEAELYRALYGENPITALQDFLERHPSGPFAREAAATLLEAALRTGRGDPELLRTASLQRVRTAADDKHGTTALEILESLPAGERWLDLREAVAQAGLEKADADLDGTATHKLRLELGRIAHARGDHKEARRHLLSAVFGMPGDGPANLALGRLHEDLGQLERARARYLLALLDMEETGSEGLHALQRVHEKLGDERKLGTVLQEMAEGRVPALHPIPREPEEIEITGKVVLVELFTGAQCPPCVAADVAFDALGEFFGEDEIALIQWHLPIPAPEPMVSDAALRRGGDLGVNGTPTAFLGDERVSGGGRAEQGPEMFARYREILEKQLEQLPSARIDGSAVLDGDRIEVRAIVEGDTDDLRLHAVLVEDLVIYPGRNGMLFHHHVARAALTPPNGARLQGNAWRGIAHLPSIAEALDRTVATFEVEGPFAVRPTEPDPEALRVVLFVTDAQGRRVQAATVPVHPEGGEGR